METAVSTDECCVVMDCAIDGTGMAFEFSDFIELFFREMIFSTIFLLHTDFILYFYFFFLYTFY